MNFNDKVYDVLKFIAQIFLPALGTLYFALSGIWGLPYGEQIVGTITAIDAFLGMILGISTKNYTGDGTLRIDTSNDDTDYYRLDVNGELASLAEKKKVILTVDPNAKL